MAKPFALQTSQGAVQLLRLLANDVRAKITVWTGFVPVVCNPFRQIEDNGHRQAMKLAGDFHERFAGFWLNIRCVHDRELAGGQPFAGDEVQNFKGILRGGLTILVVGHQAATVIGRQNLGRLELLARKRALAGAGHADQHHEGKVWNCDLHLWVRRKNSNS